MQLEAKRRVTRIAATGLAAAALASCAVPGRTSPPLPAAYSVRPFAAPTAAFAARILAAHNAERAQRRLAPLVWDPLLATGAAGYAQQLAVTGTFQHSNRQARRGVGENLWMGTGGAFAPEAMIGNWASEKRWFAPGVFPNVSRSRDWSAVGHYTQIIWPTTTRVGCGLASSRGHDVLVCRYAPAGNIDGRGVG